MHYLKTATERLLRKSLLLATLVLVAACQATDITPSVPLPDKNIVVVYENDVHCAVEGYAKFAGLRDYYQSQTPYVTTVSSGDFIQGDVLGSLTRGEAVTRILNAVGYDYVTLGNHEFDYGLDQMFAITDKLDAKVLVSNFRHIGDNSLPFAPYEIKTFGNVRIAFIGLATPSTVSSTSPAYFQDENGNPIYDFIGDDLAAHTQSVVDEARQNGADYVVVLSHLGNDIPSDPQTSLELIHNTSGIDVLLDGHSHEVIPETLVTNRNGEPVHVSSTGTKFEYMGVLTLDTAGAIHTELIETEEWTGENGQVAKVVENENKKLEELTEQVIGQSECELPYTNSEVKHLIRMQETGLGDFVTDAMRIVSGADVAAINSASIRNSIPQGDITYDDLIRLLPYSGSLILAEVTGQQLLDIMEYSCSLMPEASNSLQQVSGMRMNVDLSIEPGIEFDGDDLFAGVKPGAARRVCDLQILDKPSGQYLPVDPTKIYTLCSNVYQLKDLGSEGLYRYAKPLTGFEKLDVEAIIDYVGYYLQGVIPARYAMPDGRINILNGN